ncbi:signal peptide-containing protein [Theileria equi strain WA]|uniref:Signal peptide-containing protein n=1 Tax=Theileria equi strain WA TaxID=1537102 RepID=L0AXE8_THEEQ|nr:signal peptide-containing protein [Theileria equi strain WA]AFZ79701.1 signal peptide-containing protein [Theileria equi strain WA]|eukprot:XP_004829367.1 signal peptide-containing protein [Theileria equi strain WA]
MKVLAALWAVSLVRLCHCGELGKVDSSLFNVLCSVEDHVKVLKLTPKKGTKVTELTYGDEIVWEDKKKTCLSAILYFDDEKPTLAVLETRNKNNKQGTVYKHLDGSKWQNDKEDDHKKKLGALKEDYKPIGKPEENPPVSSAPLEQDTLNISRVDQSNLEYFEYYYDDNLIQFIAPKKGVIVRKLVNDTLWTPEKEEKFEYSKLYLDGNRKLGLILITSNFSSDIKYRYFIKSEIKWECARDYTEKMKSLKVVPAGKTDMSIDLAKVEETDECRVVNVELLKVHTRYYIPKLGYLVKEVTNGEDAIWTATGEERCTSCAIYSKNDVHLLALFIKSGNNSDNKYFEKVDGKWSFISKDFFFKKYDEMKSAWHAVGS